MQNMLLESTAKNILGQSGEGLEFWKETEEEDRHELSSGSVEEAVSVYTC